MFCFFGYYTYIEFCPQRGYCCGGKGEESHEPVKSEYIYVYITGMWAMCRHFNHPFLIEKNQTKPNRNDTKRKHSNNNKSKTNTHFFFIAWYIRITHKLREKRSSGGKSVCLCVCASSCQSQNARSWKLKMKYLVVSRQGKSTKENGMFLFQEIKNPIANQRWHARNECVCVCMCVRVAKNERKSN